MDLLGLRAFVEGDGEVEVAPAPAPAPVQGCLNSD